MADHVKRYYAFGDNPRDRLRQRAVHRFKYDQKRANDPVRLFYNSKIWRNLRARFLKQHPVCRCGVPATQVDHKRSVREDWNLRLALENLQALCQSCHSRKTAAISIAGYREFT